MIPLRAHPVFQCWLKEEILHLDAIILLTLEGYAASEIHIAMLEAIRIPATRRPL